MVVGIDKFREFFGDYGDHYAIIGGAACHLLFDDAGLEFRLSKDIDMVLCIEVIDAAFGERLRDFLNAGGYEARERSNGHREFYRFHKPKDKAFPYMIELFSRQPKILQLPEGVGVARLPADDEIYLSAILLDDDYFAALQNAKKTVDGVTVLDVTLLIPFKARAFIDLTERRWNGEKVKDKDIKKHRNDVIRLSQLLPENALIELTEPIKKDMADFLSAVEEDESINPHSFGVNLTRNEAVAFLRRVYGVAK